jgi:hypothetical protein
MSAELAVVLAAGAGEELRVEWDEAALAALAGPAQPAEAPWRLAGELDWDEVEALRVLSGRIEDGRVIAIAALRPAGAAGHDDAAGGAIIVDSVAETLAEVLISTEYADGAEIRRIGLELYPDEDGMPLRVAGDATATESEVDGGVSRLRVGLKLRLAGTPGAGLLEVLTRA